MIDFIMMILWLSFWFWIGVKFYEKAAIKKRQDSIVTKDTIMTGVKVKRIPTLNTETHEGIIFAFNSDDATFISQGSSIDEVAELAYKFRKIDLAYVIHNHEPLWFVNGKVTTINVEII
jgi:hypothetical protein